MKATLLLLAILALLPGVSAAQAPAPAPSQPPSQAPPAAPPVPDGFSYNAGGRRDPFVSRLNRGSDMRGASIGARPAGLAGLATSEVTLKGTIASRGGFVAVLQGADTKTYIVREGDRLLDGTVRTITQDALVIVQQVNDPLSLQKQREVRKALRQIEEAK